MKIYISHSGNYDYRTELYNPLKSSVIVKDYQLFFPHDVENIDINTRNFVQHSDLVVAEVSYPSTGQGIELGWASETNTPIVCICKIGSKLSSSLKFVSKESLEYDGTDDMLKRLESWLETKY
jgi:exosome complex RNA-binding protein Rrp4